MKPKFRNKYRIESARLKGWEYSNSASYFITICTKNRNHYFGEIQNGMMCLNNVGALVYNDWSRIPERNPNVTLGEFIVMPNHIHGILVLDNFNHPVETFRETSLRGEHKNHQMSKISPKSNSISRIIRSYKSAVTKYLNEQHIPFAWQTRFYDHIIRNSKSYRIISNYIKNNPKSWSNDKFR